MFVVGLCLVLAVLSLYYTVYKWRPLSSMRGPTPLPIVGNILQLDRKCMYMSMHEMKKKYGPVFRLYLFSKPVVVVSDPDSIHEVLVSKSADYAGRPSSFLADALTSNGSGLGRTDMGNDTKARRKLIHSYLKQYGSGMRRIEEVTMDATDDMINRLMKEKGRPIDICHHIFHCVTDVIAIMLVGETFSQEVIDETQLVITKAATALAKSLSSVMLDTFPLVRYCGNSAYRCVTEAVNLQSSLIDKWMALKPENGFINYIQNMTDDERKRFHISLRMQQSQLLFDFYSAGVFTTSSTLGMLMNVLCQMPDIQEKLRKEVNSVTGGSRSPVLSDRENMPYHIATLFEIGRFTSIGPLALPHKSTKITSLCNNKYTIPDNTEIAVNLWSMHHDEDLWNEPFTFDPERFLDDTGLNLVPADHPNRRHLMPFGAGQRGCVAEVFAMSRMFLILSRLVQTFHILPESTVADQPSMDPRDMKDGSVLTSPPYKVRLQLVQ